MTALPGARNKNGAKEFFGPVFSSIQQFQSLAISAPREKIPLPVPG